MRKYVLVLLAVLMVAVLVGCSTPQANKPSDSARTTDGAAQKAQQDQDVNAAAKDIEGRIGDIYFAFDKYDLDGSSKGTLKKLANILSKKSVNITVEGNCDERGTKEYNLALGDKRATAAKQYLISLGIASSRVSTVSYGKEKPICTESTEACWAKNRRDHFVVPEAAY
jgi:peptidoglycan-associated lipoprotein